ncbi:Hypothetical protein POVR1_LOCUS549 [uncultured virus]|nr:Hypothetical protein POVR1_LOCUS549 [uncultured virus]
MISYQAAVLHNLDLLTEIMKHLCYVDVMAFRWTCHHCQKVNQPSFKEIIVNRLSDLLQFDPNLREIFPTHEVYKQSVSDLRERLYRGRITDPEEYRTVGELMQKHRHYFFQELIESKSIISGSFIIDCLYDTNHHNDIDIYVSDGKMDDYMRVSGFVDKINPSSDQSLPVTNLVLQNGDQSIHVQLIYIPLAFYEANVDSVKDIRSVINATYDLDICKSSFECERLYVRSWPKLFGRYDYIKCNMRFVMRYYGGDLAEDGGVNLEATEERMKKYQDRGFRIEHHPMNSQIVDHIMNSMSDPELIGIDAVLTGKINLDKFFLE